MNSSILERCKVWGATGSKVVVIGTGLTVTQDSFQNYIFEESREGVFAMVNPLGEVTIVNDFCHNDTYSALFRVKKYANRSNKHLGLRWVDRFNNSLISELPIRVKDDRLERLVPLKTRTVDKEAKKAFDARIRKVRDALMARNRFGLLKPGNCPRTTSTIDETWELITRCEDLSLAPLNDLCTVILWSVTVSGLHRLRSVRNEAIDYFFRESKEPLMQHLGIVTYV